MYYAPSQWTSFRKSREPDWQVCDIYSSPDTRSWPENDEFVDLDRDDTALDALRDVVKTRLHGERAIAERA